MSAKDARRHFTEAAEARLENPIPKLSNLEIHLSGTEGQEIPGVLYGKIVEAIGGSHTDFYVRFTSISPEIETVLDVLLAPGSAAQVERTEPAGPEKTQPRPQGRILRVV